MSEKGMGHKIVAAMATDIPEDVDFDSELARKCIEAGAIESYEGRLLSLHGEFVMAFDGQFPHWPWDEDTARIAGDVVAGRDPRAWAKK